MSYGDNNMRDVGQGTGQSDAQVRGLLREMAVPAYLANPPVREDLLSAASDSAQASTGPSGGLHRLGLAVAAVAVLLVGFLAVQVWQGRDSGSQPKGMLAPDTAWAAVDGVILEYEFISFVEEERSGTVTTNDRMQEVLSSISEQYAHLCPIGFDEPIARSDSWRGVNFERWGWSQCRVIVASDDRELLDTLKDKVAQIPGVWGPREYLQTFYYSEKYPDRMIPGRVIWINGKEYKVPEDFNHFEMHFVLELLKLDPDTISYRAHWRLDNFADEPSTPDAFDLGDVVRITVRENGDFEITTIAQVAEFELPLENYSRWYTKNIDDPDAEAEELVFLPEVRVNVSRDDVQQGFDPLAALQAEYDKMANSASMPDDPSHILYEYYYPVFAEDRYRTNLNIEFSQAEKEHSVAVLDSARTAAEQFGNSHDDITVKADGRKLVHVRRLIMGEDLVLVLCAAIRTGSPETASEFASTISEATGLQASLSLIHGPPEQ